MTAVAGVEVQVEEAQVDEGRVDQMRVDEIRTDEIQVEVIRAWSRGVEQVTLRLPAGATVATALAASGVRVAEVSGYAVFGTRAQPETVLRNGDRVELLRPLLIDPKDARRRRARK